MANKKKLVDALHPVDGAQVMGDLYWGRCLKEAPFFPLADVGCLDVAGAGSVAIPISLHVCISDLEVLRSY